jgi:DNA polymerase-3 subunit gamma/tau
MTYQPLARKYRPTRFSELVGQEAVAKALANAITMGREPHALIFTGVRGVGKTTVARLYAKALNCEQRGPDAEPCNACESCVAIARGHHEDVLEIDGASNNGVGDVRALQETVEYQAQRSKFKVYIIDEVHMLSTPAFNALLKTLEEPPAHCVFVFATTEMAKVPETILSRCQAFYLKKMTTAHILGRLKELFAKEGIAAEDKAIAIIAREGHGSMRDALTLADQAIALGKGQVTVASLGGIVSNLSSSPYLDLLGALIERNAERAVQNIARLDQGGADFVNVVEETAQLARHAFVVQGLGVKALDLALLGLDDGEVQELTRLAQIAQPFDLNRIFRTLVKCRLELDGSALDRYVLENYLFEWCFDPGLPDLDTLMSGAAKGKPLTAPPTPVKIAPITPVRHAQAPQSGADHRSQAPQSGADRHGQAPQSGAVGHPEAPAQQGATAKALPGTWRQLVDAWKKQKPLQARKLEEAHPLEYNTDRIVLAVSEQSFASKVLLQADEQARVRDQFRELFGFTGTLIVKPKVEATAGQAGQLAPENILTEKTREQLARREQLIEDAKNAPFTQDLIQALGGTIQDVKIPE